MNLVTPKETTADDLVSQWVVEHNLNAIEVSRLKEVLAAGEDEATLRKEIQDLLIARELEAVSTPEDKLDAYVRRTNYTLDEVPPLE